MTTVVLTLGVGGLGILAVVPHRALHEHARRAARFLAWVVAMVLVLYGGVLTLVGLLGEAGVVAASARTDQRAFGWHRFLWNPWWWSGVSCC